MIKYLAIIPFAALAAFGVDVRTLPSPPSGFVWEPLEAAGGAIRKPISWTKRAIEVDGGIGYLIAEENLFKTNDYFTGLKIKYTYLDPKKKYTPSDTMRGIYKKFQKNADISDLVLTTEGGFSVARFYYTEVVKHESGTIPHYFTTEIMYNDSARVLIWISFDCPLSKWQEKSKVAEVMLSDIKVYDFDKNGEPNKSLQPTATAVTDRADARSAPASAVADH